MKQRMALALVAVAAIAVACKPGEAPEARASRDKAVVDSARTKVLADLASWVRFVNQSHPDSISTLFGTNGTMMPPDMPSAMGHDSINARNKLLVIPGGTLTITSRDISVSDPIAVSRGVWSYAIPAMGRSPALTIKGSYLSHWHHGDSGWKIADTIWNNDSTARPPMPPAAAMHH